MEEAAFEYKCRRCQEVFAGPHTGTDAAESMLWKLILSKDGSGVISNKLLHECKGGGTGIADLIGYGVEQKG